MDCISVSVGSGRTVGDTRAGVQGLVGSFGIAHFIPSLLFWCMVSEMVFMAVSPSMMVERLRINELAYNTDGRSSVCNNPVLDSGNVVGDLCESYMRFSSARTSSRYGNIGSFWE